MELETIFCNSLLFDFLLTLLLPFFFSPKCSEDYIFFSWINIENQYSKYTKVCIILLMKSQSNLSG